MKSPVDIPEEEPRDRTKWLWLGVVVLFAALVAAMWLMGQGKSDMTRARAKHILVKFAANDPVDRARALETITDLRKRIENGESFAKLAKEFSGDEFSSERGGDLGYAAKGTYEGGIETYIWTAPIGQLSDVIQTKYGFHLVVVLDRHVSSADQYEMELEKKAAERKKSAAIESGTSEKAPSEKAPSPAPAAPSP